MYGKLSPKGAWLGHVNHLNIGGQCLEWLIVSGAVNLGGLSVW